MTCKDCPHFDVCEMYGAFHTKRRIGSKWKNCPFRNDKAKYIELPCKIGQIVYDVVLCDDDIYRIFEMKISAITPFGSLHESINRSPFIWNIYLTDDYSYAYRVFSDVGKKIFFDKSEAEAKLKELEDETS